MVGFVYTQLSVYATIGMWGNDKMTAGAIHVDSHASVAMYLCNLTVNV